MLRTSRTNLLGDIRLLEFSRPGAKFAFTSASDVYGDPRVSLQPESSVGW
jgi:hypothetical protein